MKNNRDKILKLYNYFFYLFFQKDDDEIKDNIIIRYDINSLKNVLFFG